MDRKLRRRVDRVQLRHIACFDMKKKNLQGNDLPWLKKIYEERKTRSKNLLRFIVRVVLCSWLRWNLNSSIPFLSSGCTDSLAFLFRTLVKASRDYVTNFTRVRGHLCYRKKTTKIASGFRNLGFDLGLTSSIVFYTGYNHFCYICHIKVPMK